MKQETHAVGVRIARLRTHWSDTGRELNRLKADQEISCVISPRLLLDISNHDRSKYRAPYFREKEEIQEPAGIA